MIIIVLLKIFKFYCGRWDLETQLDFPEHENVDDLLFHPCGNLLAIFVCSNDDDSPRFLCEEIVIRSTSDASLYLHLEGSSRPISMTFNQDGARLLSASISTASLRTHCVSTGTLLTTTKLDSIACIVSAKNSTNIEVFTFNGHLLQYDEHGKQFEGQPIDLDVVFNDTCQVLIQESVMYITDSFCVQRRDICKPEQVVWKTTFDSSTVMCVSLQGDKVAVLDHEEASILCAYTGNTLKIIPFERKFLDWDPIWTFFNLDGTALVVGFDTSTTALYIYPEEKKKITSFFSGVELEHLPITRLRQISLSV